MGRTVYDPNPLSIYPNPLILCRVHVGFTSRVKIASSTRAPIPSNLKISFLDIDDILPVISSYDLPRGQENRLLGLLEEHKETTEVEKFPQYSPHFTSVHDSLPDEKLFENTQRDLPQYAKIQNYLSIGKIHSLWSKRRKDWCFKFKLKG
jgi:hypothetical protein